MNNKIEMLKKMPIYSMSLASKELFHSNFWGWLIETDSNFIKIFSTDVVVKNAREYVHREKNHMDLQIDLENNEILVVENKIKSLPTIEQLKKYTKKLNNDKLKLKLKQGILTGLSNTLNNVLGKGNELEKWKFISYEQIAKSIIGCLKVSQKDEIKKNTKIIEDYCEMVLSLSKIMNDKLGKLDEDKVLTFEAKELEKIKFDDIYKKFKADHFVKFLQSKKDLTDLTVLGEKVKITHGFSRKTPYIDIRFNNEKFVSIAVQLQWQQFRSLVDERDKRDVDDIFNKFCKYRWFDSEYEIENKKIIDKFTKKLRITKMTPRKDKNGECKKYNTYETYKYVNVYQYYDLDEKQGELNYDSLYERILCYMKEAKRILEEKYNT